MISSICAKLVMLCMAGLLGGFVWLLVCVFTKRKKKPCFVVCAACVGGFVVFTLIGSLTSPYANCDHNFQLAETQEATCEKSGKEIYRCSLCGMERKETIPAGHDMSEVTITEPTYEADGERLVRCTRCGKEEREVLPKLEYSLSVRNFSVRAKAPEALGKNIEDVLTEMGYKATLDDLKGWEKTDDWAEGERYKAWWYDMYESEYHYLLFYVTDNTVVSIYSQDGTRELIYSAGN